MSMQAWYLTVPLAPLFGAIVAGLFGKFIGRTLSHLVTIAGVAIAFIASVVIFQDVQAGHSFNGSVYTWMSSGLITTGDVRFEVGFLIDPLTTMMMLVVSFVSLMGHIWDLDRRHEEMVARLDGTYGIPDGDR